MLFLLCNSLVFPSKIPKDFMNQLIITCQDNILTFFITLAEHDKPVASFTTIAVELQVRYKNGENVKMCNWPRKVEFLGHIILIDGLLRTSQMASSIINETLLHIWRIQKFFVFPGFFFPYCSSPTILFKKWFLVQKHKEEHLSLIDPGCLSLASTKWPWQDKV